jgi:hypothetical protein
MADVIRVRREVDGGTQVEECEIFTFPTEEDRQAFISDLRKFDPEVAYATNMDTEESQAERYLVAVPIRFYNWVTKERHNAC